MRRAPIVITATVLGTAGVLLFKPLPVSSLEGTSTNTAGSSSTAGTSAPSSASSATTTPSSSASHAVPATPVSATVTGAVESDRYGDTQVKVTITRGRIAAVTVLAYNNGDPRSAQISEQAIPTLRSEVLSKQTAAVDAVSGATYTSNAYKASLQSALDTAGFVAADRSTASTDLAAADANLGGQ